MLKTANETCHKSGLDRMAGWTGWFSASFILQSSAPAHERRANGVYLSTKT
jgi:hypothetical protein